MKDNLLIVNKIKKTILYIDKIIINFPNNEYVLKDKIKSTSYEILELVYFANCLTGKERILYQKKVIVKLKMLDFCFKISMDKKYISYKKYVKIGNFLLDISKALYGWINSEKSK